MGCMYEQPHVLLITNMSLGEIEIYGIRGIIYYTVQDFSALVSCFVFIYFIHQCLVSSV